MEKLVVYVQHCDVHGKKPFGVFRYGKPYFRIIRRYNTFPETLDTFSVRQLFRVNAIPPPLLLDKTSKPSRIFNDRVCSTSCHSNLTWIYKGSVHVPWHPSGFDSLKFQNPFLHESHLLPSTLVLQWHRPDSRPLARSVFESHIPSSNEPPGSQSHAMVEQAIMDY